MKTYVISGLDAARRKTLKDAGITLFDWSDGAVLLEEQYLADVLSLLNATAAEEEATDEGLTPLTLRFRSTATAAADGGRRKRHDPQREQARASYIRICAARLQQITKEARAEQQRLSEQLPKLQPGFVSATRAAAFAADPAGADVFAEEFERLCAVDKVVDVQVVPGTLFIYTDTLCATHKPSGKEYELGRFTIIVPTDGSVQGIRWLNSDRQVDGIRQQMQAPNVYEDGTPCADEMYQTILELVARCEFAVVAELAIQFVEETENERLSAYLPNWPKRSARRKRGFHG